MAEAMCSLQQVADELDTFQCTDPEELYDDFFVIKGFKITLVKLRFKRARNAVNPSTITKAQQKCIIKACESIIVISTGKARSALHVRSRLPKEPRVIAMEQMSLDLQDTLSNRREARQTTSAKTLSLLWLAEIVEKLQQLESNCEELGLSELAKRDADHIVNLLSADRAAAIKDVSDAVKEYDEPLHQLLAPMLEEQHPNFRDNVIVRGNAKVTHGSVGGPGCEGEPSEGLELRDVRVEGNARVHFGRRIGGSYVLGHKRILHVTSDSFKMQTECIEIGCGD